MKLFRGLLISLLLTNILSAKCDLYSDETHYATRLYSFETRSCPSTYIPLNEVTCINNKRLMQYHDCKEKSVCEGGYSCKRSYYLAYLREECLEGAYKDEDGICRRPCQLPNIDFPSKATNETILFNWQEDNNQSTKCITQQGNIQEKTQDCKKKYRCIKETEDDKNSCRNQETGSYISPTARVFHEDIALVGTDINLHYQTQYLDNETIAYGWSLNIHHTIDEDYLHLGNGKLINISSSKVQEDNQTIISLANLVYIFNKDNLHVETKDIYTEKSIYRFEYNLNHKLISITDSFTNTHRLDRDVDDKVVSITTPNGQLTYLHVDTNNNLQSITYEDNSNYTFIYDNHLMTSETEPNGNEFLHEFDENAKVTRVIDAEQGVWSFSNITNNTYKETIVNKASGDTISYKDYFLNNDNLMLSETTIASGDIFKSSSSVDGNTKSSNSCGVSNTTTYETQKDQLSKQSVPSSTTTTMPSGLSKTT